MTEPRKSISPRLVAAIELLAAGSTITAAAAGVGMRRQVLSRAWGKAHVREYARERMAVTLGFGAVRAAVRLRELCEEPGMAGFQASRWVAGAGGGVVLPQASSTTVNILAGDVKPGFIIDISEPSLLHGDGMVIDGTAVECPQSGTKPNDR